MRAKIRRYVLGVLILVPLVFAPGAQPQAALVTDADGLVTDVNGVLVGGLTYNIAFTFGTYDALFGGVLFANAGNFVTAINAELNAPSPIPLITFGPDKFEPAQSYFLPRVFGAGSGATLQVTLDRGRCVIATGLIPPCLPSSTWTGPSTGNTFVSTRIGYAVPTLVSAVPLPAALPLFGSALAMLGIVGWRRKRRAAA